MSLVPRIFGCMIPIVAWSAENEIALAATPSSAQTTAAESSSNCLLTYGKYRFSIIGEFLYWKPTEGGTEFTFSTRTSSPIPGSMSPSYVPFKWEPGFRVGAKYYLPDQRWRFSLSAANLDSSVSSHLSGVLFPLQAAQSTLQSGLSGFTNSLTAAAHWKMDYWVFDFRCGCERPFCKSFLFHPYAGLKGALIHQHFRYTYGSVAEATPSTQNYSIFTRNHCNNIGVQGGLRGEWAFAHGFRLLGDCSLALLYGWFHVDQNQSGQTGLANTIDFSSEFQRLLPAANLFFGLSWGTYFCHCSNHIEFHAGYETQYWWRQNQSPRFMSGTSPYYFLASEDLGLQGLTLGGNFDF